MTRKAPSLRKEVAFFKSFTGSRSRLILIICVLMYISYFLRGITEVRKTTATVPAPKRKLPWTTSCGVPVQNDPIINVNNNKTYLVSSYIEHRQDVKMIKTIAIVLRSENAEYHCLMCCNGTYCFVPASYSIHSDHFGYDYGTADITCKIPEMCSSPTHVAITSHSAKLNRSSQNVIFQPVRNQHTQNDFPFNFTVCISTMFDYSNVLQLIQAMEMFKILGVQRVAIYKTNCSSVVQKILDYYVMKNVVDLIPWNISSYIKVSRGWRKNVSPGELHYFGQIAALNDCVYRYMYQSHYVALHDMDEFIIPMKVKTWTELLPELVKQYGLKAAYQFENNVFPLAITETNQSSPHSWSRVNGFDLLKHVYRVNNVDRKKDGLKAIVNPRSVFITSVHHLLEPNKDYALVDSKIAKMYHFKNVSRKYLSSDTDIKDTRIRDFADRLIPAVSEVLQQVLSIY